MIQTFVTSLPFIVCAIYSAQLVLRTPKDQHQRSHIILLAFMLTAMLLYGCHWIYFNHVVGLIPLSDTVYVTCNLAVYPLYTLYIMEMTGHRPHKKALLMLLPATIIGLSCGILYALMDHPTTEHFILQYLYHDTINGLNGNPWLLAIVHIIGKLIFAVQVIATVIVGLRHIKAYNHLVSSLYADTEERTLHSLHTILWLVLVTAIASFLSNAIGRWQFTDHLLLLLFPSLTFSTLLFFIGYVGLFQQFSFVDIEQEEAFSEDMPADEYPPNISSNLLTDEIIKLVSEQQLYLRADLKLNDLAQMMNSNRTYVYNAINRNMGISFSDFINRQRIDYAERLITEQPQMTIQEIMHQAGFNSSSSFYRNFKKFKGYRPHQK